MNYEAFANFLESEALEAGKRGGEAFSKSKYAISEYWLCIEFKMQRIHDEYCRRFLIDRACKHSDFRKFIASKRREWSKGEPND